MINFAVWSTAAAGGLRLCMGADIIARLRLASQAKKTLILAIPARAVGAPTDNVAAAAAGGGVAVGRSTAAFAYYRLERPTSRGDR